MKSNLFFWTSCIILTLSAITISPWMYPADFSKNIIFRSILAIFLFLFLYQILTKKNILSDKSNTTNLFVVLSNKIIWALMGLLGIFLLSTIFSVDKYFSLWGSPWRGGGVVNFIFYIIFTILLFLNIKKEDWPKLWNFSFFIGAIISLMAIIQYYGLFSSIFTTAQSRPASTLGNTIILAIYCSLLLFNIIPLTIKEKNLTKKTLYCLCAIVFVFTIIISETRAVYIGSAVGLLHFLIAYPKKLKVAKINTIIFVSIIILTIIFTNLVPGFLGKIGNRFLIKNALGDERFASWQVALKGLMQKPLLGWGPENFAVAFDKNYDPILISSFWWDRAHNIFLDIGVQTGFLGIIAYILLFITLFWQLQKIRQKIPEDKSLIIHGIQSSLIAYLVANFFSFDAFGTYLIFFFIIAYILHITTPEICYSNKSTQNNQKLKLKKPIIIFAFIILILFLWQYNILPFYINTQINIANALSKNKQCQDALNLMDRTLKYKSFLNSYIRMKYVEITKTCQEFYPEKTTDYIKKDYELLKEAVKIQPLYTRYWISLGQFASNLKDYNKANEYFNKALELAPKHKEILEYKLETSIALQNYQELIIIYQYLIEKDPNNFQYHASLAYVYKITGNFELAKKEALIVIELSPESKKVTEEFLKSLPH